MAALEGIRVVELLQTVGEIGGRANNQVSGLFLLLGLVAVVG